MTDEFKLGAIGQISRKVKNIETARRWYGEVLGLSHLYSFGKLAFFDLNGVRLFLSEDGAASNDESILYFRVEDIHHACRMLTTRGVAFRDQPHMIHRHADGMEEWMAFFSDPDGKALAIMAQTKTHH
ncbi:MAG TPA: VOC family protein [Rhizomicrobium sp.]|nr:VOC family protein [Rhizomicrobium sp.]